MLLSGPRSQGAGLRRRPRRASGKTVTSSALQLAVHLPHRGRADVVAGLEVADREQTERADLGIGRDHHRVVLAVAGEDGDGVSGNLLDGAAQAGRRGGLGVVGQHRCRDREKRGSRGLNACRPPSLRVRARFYGRLEEVDKRSRRSTRGSEPVVTRCIGYTVAPTGSGEAPANEPRVGLPGASLAKRGWGRLLLPRCLPRENEVRRARPGADRPGEAAGAGIGRRQVKSRDCRFR